VTFTLISENPVQKTRKAALFAVLLTMIFVFGHVGAIAQESEPFSIDNSPLPAPTGFVNDYAGVIDAATKQQL
jgi:hypothetical protein